MILCRRSYCLLQGNNFLKFNSGPVALASLLTFLYYLLKQSNRKR